MDIDIDFANPKKAMELFPNWTKASIVQNEKISNHPCGIYPQNIPIDPISKLSAIPYKDAENLGYFKLDFLSNKIYQYINSRNELKELISIEPDWTLLQSPRIVKQLFQLHNHFDTLQIIKPTSIEELSDTLAIIRPGKQHLIKLYHSEKESIRNIYLYESNKNSDNFGFKKSHSIAYALVVVVQLHLIKAGIEF